MPGINHTKTVTSRVNSSIHTLALCLFAGTKKAYALLSFSFLLGIVIVHSASILRNPFQIHKILCDLCLVPDYGFIPKILHCEFTSMVDDDNFCCSYYFIYYIDYYYYTSHSHTSHWSSNYKNNCIIIKLCCGCNVRS